MFCVMIIPELLKETKNRGQIKFVDNRQINIVNISRKVRNDQAIFLRFNL